MNKTRRAMSGLFGVLFGFMSVSSAAAMSPNLLEGKTYAGIPYLSGGVGVDEREALRHMSTGDNLKLVFAAKNGAYLSDVNVMITDSQGHKVLEAVSQGPWFFTKLPAGKYHVTAETMGRSLQRMIQAPRRGQTQALFSWENSILKAPARSMAGR